MFFICGCYKLLLCFLKDLSIYFVHCTFREKGCTFPSPSNAFQSCDWREPVGKGVWERGRRGWERRDRERGREGGERERGKGVRGQDPTNICLISFFLWQYPPENFAQLYNIILQLRIACSTWFKKDYFEGIFLIFNKCYLYYSYQFALSCSVLQSRWNLGQFTKQVRSRIGVVFLHWSLPFWVGVILWDDNESFCIALHTENNMRCCVVVICVMYLGLVWLSNITVFD